MADENATQTEMQKAVNAFEDMLTPVEEKEAEPREVEAEATTEATEEVEQETEQSEDYTDDREEEGEILDDDEDVADDDEQSVEEDENQLLHTVTVNGQSEQVTTEELIKGYSRQADYTRKTQTLGEERNKLDAEKSNFEAQKAEVISQGQEYSELLPKMKVMLNNNLQGEPDWNSLADQVTPAEYLKIQNEWNKNKDSLAIVDNELARLDQLKQQEAQQAQLQEIEKGKALISEKLPEWSDPKVAQTEAVEMTKHAQDTYGFTPEELGQVVDGRLILLLRDAYMYRKNSSVARKRAKEAPTTTLKAGTATTRKTRGSQKLKNARVKAAKSGKVSDVAEVFKSII